ncbi:MAG: PAS domain S-box protein [Cyanobacteria bacterium P01_A01_bin.135]
MSQTPSDWNPLIAAIARQTQRSLDLAQILQGAADHLQRLLACDRLLIYRFGPGGSGQVTFEAVSDPAWSLLGREIEADDLGRIVPDDERCAAIDNVATADLAPRHRALLTRLQAQASLAVPLFDSAPWGLLLAQQCTAPRNWQDAEVAGLQQVAVHLSIAIHQAALRAQLQAQALPTAEASQTPPDAALRHQAVTPQNGDETSPEDVLQLSRRLQESEQRYASLVAAAPVGIFRTDAAGQCIYVNDRWEQMTGILQSEALGDRWAEAIYKGDRDRVFQAWTEAARGQRIFALEYRLQHWGGSIAWVYGQAVPEYSSAGQLLGYVGTLTDITERKQIEAERQRAAQVRLELSLLEQILDVVLAGYWDWDIPNHTEYLSPGFKRMFGYEDHELANSPDSWQQLIFPEDLPKALAQFERHVQSRGALPYYNEVRYRHKDGSTIWVICSGQVIEWDHQGNPLRMIGCHIDITERKQAEAALQKSERTNRALIHALPDFLVRMRQDGTQLAVINAGNIHCLSPEDSANLQPSVLEIMPKPIAQERVVLAQRAIASGEVQRQEYSFTSAGETYYEEARITPLQGDEVLVVVRDITQRLRAEHVLRDSEATKRALINAIPDRMTRIRADGLCIDILHQDSILHQDTQAAAVRQGHHITQVLPPALAQERMAYVQRALDTGVAQQYEYQVEVEGRRYDEEARLIPLDETSVLAVIRDISDQKQKEHRLQTAMDAADTANRAKSEFLANMSHEIRTPMNAVMGFTELLQRDVRDASAQEYLAAIASSGQTLLHLINDILDLSKIEAGRLELYPEPVDVRAMVQEVGAIFSQKTLRSDVELHIQVADTVPAYLWLDDVRLRQILFNVVGNALKFTGSGAVTLEVEASPPDLPQGSVDLQITVADTGIGIAPEQQRMIFDAFTQAEGQSTRQYGGTGLGLAITRRLVDLMGGQITLESQLGQGSRFTFHFPNIECINPEASPETADLTADLNRFAPARILVVDDVASNRALLAGYFRGTAHSLIFAADGDEALRLVAQDRPDVILMDLRMPRMDGLEATQRLKADAATAPIPVVLVTASSQRGDEARLRQLCQGFVRKPVSLGQLVEALTPLLPGVSSVTPPNAAAVPRSAPTLELSPDEQRRLIDQLTHIATALWQPMRQTLAIEQVEQFAAALGQLAVDIPHPALVDYIHTLSQQLTAFDWAAIPKTIAAFEVLRQAIAGVN